MTARHSEQMLADLMVGVDPDLNLTLEDWGIDERGTNEIPPEYRYVYTAAPECVPSWCPARVGIFTHGNELAVTMDNGQWLVHFLFRKD